MNKSVSTLTVHYTGNIMLLDAGETLNVTENEREELNRTDEEYLLFSREFVEDKLVQIIFCMIYTTIFILGLTGNMLVCFVVARNKTMQTVTNLFITNLALSDILLCILAVPFTPLYTFTGHWAFGRVLCHLVPFAQGISVYVSTLTLTSIAVDRFFVIIYPFKPRMKLATCVTIIVAIWIFAVLITLPYCIYMFQKPINGKYYCEEQWPIDYVGMIYGSLTVILQFIIPFFIIAVCYIKVSLKLRDRARAKPGQKNSRKEEMERERKKRTNRMLIAMVAIFGLCWSLLNGINLMNDIYPHTGHWKYYYLTFFVSHALAMSSTCYNPFLYAWLNDNFRKEFKQVLPCFQNFRRGGARSLNGTRGVLRTERTCNGNETCQETLLPTSSVIFPSRQTEPSSVDLDYSSGLVGGATKTKAWVIKNHDSVEMMMMTLSAQDTAKKQLISSAPANNVAHSMSNAIPVTNSEDTNNCHRV